MNDHSAKIHKDKDINKGIDHLKSVSSAAFYLIIILCCLGIRVFAANDLYFVYGQPGTDMMNKLPFPTKLFCLNVDSNTLNEVWSTEKYVKTINIVNQSEIKKLILLEDNGKFRLFNYNDIPAHKYLDLEYLGPISRRFYYENRLGDDDEIIVQKINVDKSAYPPSSFEIERIPVDDGKLVGNADSIKGAFELTLGGRDITIWQWHK